MDILKIPIVMSEAKNHLSRAEKRKVAKRE